ELRAVEQAGKTGGPRRGLAPERFYLHIRRFTDGRREIVRDELTMDGHQPADCILEDFTGAGWPEEKPDQAVAQDADGRLLDTQYDRLKIVGRVDTAGKRKERRGKPGTRPERPARPADRHEGAEAGESTQARQEQPAIRGERGDQGERRHPGQSCPRQPQQALVQRLADGRQGTERYRKASPV